ncbi:MAG: hypothetical protein R3A47_06185 [Polyangiales bacterium]
MRPWHEYVASLHRLYAMELEAAQKKEGPKPPDPLYMPAVLEWWMENFSLISDVVTRQYPFYMVTYHNVLHDTEATLRPIFQWLGAGDADAAIAGVDNEMRTQKSASAEPDAEVPADALSVFDEFFDLVNRHETITQPFVDKLNETNTALMPLVTEWQKKVRTHQLSRRKWFHENKMKEPPSAVQ